MPLVLSIAHVGLYKQRRSSFSPEKHLPLDQPGACHSQHSSHRVREWIGEGHRRSLLLVKHDGVFICNLKEAFVLVSSENDLKVPLQ